jgi:hypothetical protein
VGLTPDLERWVCFHCNEDGDSIDFASLVLTGRRLRDCSVLERDQVRQWFLDLTGASASSPASTTPPGRLYKEESPSSTPGPALEPELPRPPIDQLQHLWSKCSTRCDMTAEHAERIRLERTLNPAADAGLRVAIETAEYVRRQRNIDATTLADAGLAVALVRDDRALSFARLWDRDAKRWLRWFDTGYLLLFKLYDHRGVARSVIARCVRTPPTGLPKSASPEGFKRARLVMANGLARQMLQHGTHPSLWPVATSGDPFPLDDAWWPADEPFWLVIAEGEPDFATWCTSPVWPESNPFAPAVLGIVSGSWNRDFATRIPVGTRVIISEQTKANGETGHAAQQYTQKILATLTDRSDLTVSIWRAPECDGDEHDEHDDTTEEI